MESRFENQDRMINYLLQQFGSVESSVQNNRRQMSDLQERDREQFLKTKNDLVGRVEISNQQLSDLIQKVNYLSETSDRSETTKNELRTQLTKAEESNTQMANFIRSLSSQSEAELAQMRNIL